jgi:alkanesulfonate monooxygenase SsuD/methylene tetrahydromethanopterin reductase-like flavin-dependent oxidoreductase (luciferase family)
VKLGVALTWHVHPWEDLLALVRRAEALGYTAAFVDGDISQLDSSSDRDVLDGWTVTTALLARTQRIQIGSMRLVHHWNAARLAQAVATAERITPQRLRFVIGLGDRPNDECFGLRKLSAAERTRWLDEMLDAVRRLWRGEVVSCSGRYVTLSEARVRPLPPDGAIPVAIAAGKPRMLELVAAHADIWEVNLPPVRHRVEAAAALIERACDRHGRDAGAIARTQWIFTRAGDAADALAEYRRWNPWFREIPDAEVAAGIAAGSPAQCRQRLTELRGELGLDLPVIDLSGLPAGPARHLLEACAPDESSVDAEISTT